MTIDINRRQMLQHSGAGFGALALAELLSRQSKCSADAAIDGSSSQYRGHFPARAKRIIFLFMHGGPSHVDTFDYKPQLAARDGQPLPFAKPRVQFAETGNLLASPWKFQQYGESGAWVSDLFPHVGRCVDDITFIKSIHGSNEAHGGAMLKVHTGSDTFVRPSMGAWISYGLGSENENLPSFITINPTLGHGGVQNFGSAFLPPIHQATRIANAAGSGQAINNLTNENVPKSLQSMQLDLLKNLDRLKRPGAHTSADANLDARIESFELAFRMQTEAPQILDISGESESTNKLYGIDGGPTDSFGRQCLLARRMSESGVRMIQVNQSYWDQHGELKEQHAELAGKVDRPIAGLLTDLKQRGLLDDTLLIWGGEFGRTPTSQGAARNGRDHNPHAFTYWMAGGGVKGGFSYGESDEFGFYAANDKVHIHDLHATILHLMGIDHERLTYRYGGRDFRLTDVEGDVKKAIFA